MDRNTKFDERIDRAANEIWTCVREIGHTLSSEIAVRKVRQQLEGIARNWNDHIAKLETDLRNRNRKISELKKVIASMSAAEGPDHGRSRSGQ
jgi:uncharacterized coiled-coil DUF342 family protein